MHGVRRELLLRQAGAVGPPVHEVTIPWPCRNEEYEAAMSAVVAAARDQGVSRMAFGDLFLADIRAYRAGEAPRYRSRADVPVVGPRHRSTPDSDWTAFYPMSSGPPGRLPCGQRDAGQE